MECDLETAPPLNDSLLIPDVSLLKTKINFSKSVVIFWESLLQWPMWFYMAVAEIRRRYRRTLLGPFWTTLNVIIFITCMGLVFPRLWHVNTSSFLPFFASGFVIWTFISTTITDACGTFIDVSNIIKYVNLPYPIYAINVVARNFLVLLHHLVAYAAIMLIFRVPLSLNILFIVPAMVILSLTSVSVCILLGFLTTRFRDFKQIITNLLQISLFVTPVFWKPVQLGQGFYAQYLVALNPLYYFIEIARSPLLGKQPALSVWLITSIIGFVMWIMAMQIMRKYYKHLVFWL